MPSFEILATSPVQLLPKTLPETLPATGPETGPEMRAETPSETQAESAFAAQAGLPVNASAEMSAQAALISPPNGALSESEISWREIMQKGSKTFSLAARLFARENREGAELLYAWCRFCDDAIDSAPDQPTAIGALENVRQQTELAVRSSASAQACNPAFRALASICETYAIPALYPLELINGMEMDTRGIRIRTEPDLNLYCYRVASVVGLMMSHIMGVSDVRALPHAAHTGLAMQMTNIARDISDDFMMGRIYIPDKWFADAGFVRPNVEAGAEFHAGEFAVVTRRLVLLADRYYASGLAGIRYLPWRAAFAVRAAQLVYREIGIKVLSRGAKAWETRTVVGLGRKLTLMSRAVIEVVIIKLRGSLGSRRGPDRRESGLNPGRPAGGLAGSFELGGHPFRASDL